jgi:hypothetical protein
LSVAWWGPPPDFNRMTTREHLLGIHIYDVSIFVPKALEAQEVQLAGAFLRAKRATKYPKQRVRKGKRRFLLFRLQSTPSVVAFEPLTTTAASAAGPIFASATDGAQFALTDIPPGSLMKLPSLGFIAEDDPLFVRPMTGCTHRTISTHTRSRNSACLAATACPSPLLG